VASTPATATWYHVNFDTNSSAINSNGQRVVADLSSYLQRNPAAIATIVGRTDTVGSADYNMHLSHQRADAVRDAVVYGNKIAADRVETRWSGENRPDMATADNVATAANRVVDIAIH
jgi:outer membrane protein OmpA-like peptidoglycan-associated protein